MTKEEVIIQFLVGSEGMGGQLAAVQAEVDTSSRAMMESQIAANKAAAVQYVATWKAAESEKAMLSIANETELQTKLAEIDVAAAEKRKVAMVAINSEAGVAMARQQGANDAIQAGSGAFGSLEAGAVGGAAMAGRAESGGIAEGVAGATEAVEMAGAYAFGKGGQLIGKLGEDGKLIKTAEGLEKMGEAAARAGMGAAKLRGGVVIMDEYLRNAGIARISSSIFRLAAMIGSIPILVPALIAASVAGIAEFLPRLWGGATISGTLDTRAQTDEARKGAQTSAERDVEKMNQRLEAMVKSGLISKEEGENRKNQLKEALDQLRTESKEKTPWLFGNGPGNKGAKMLGAAVSEINALAPMEGAKEAATAAVKTEEINHKAAREAAKAGMVDASDADKLEDARKQEVEITDKMGKLDRDAVGYKEMNNQLQKELNEADVDYNEADKRIKAAKAREDQKALDLAREQTQAISEAQLHANEIGQRHDESFMPTLQELAHSGGQFGSQARRALQDEKRAKRDYMHGNVSGAQADIADRDKIYDSLSGKGVVAESAESREIKQLNAQLAIHFKGMPDNLKNPAWIKPILK